jgi:thymidylate kinase
MKSSELALSKNFRDSKRVGQYLAHLFDRFNTEGINYCVLHSYEELPEYAPSDVDMAVHSDDLSKVEGIVFDVAGSLGFQVVQKLYYDIPRCYYYVLFFRDDDGTPGVVQLDFLNDDFGVGRYILKTDTLLEGRRRFNNFFVPSVPVETCYLLIKKTIKKKFAPEHQLKLQRLHDEEPASVEEMLARYFGAGNLTSILQLIRGADGIDQSYLIERLRRFLFVRYRLSRPHVLLLSYLWLARRVIERMLFPTGLIAIVISPDGGGKSTIADILLKRLGYCFRNTKRLHWRPYLLPPPRKLLTPRKWNESEEPNYDPHGKPPKRMLTSLARFFYYLADYIIGYPSKVFWPKIRTHFVVFERYYYDFLLDTKRFRLKLPPWLPQAALHLVPKGDLVFLLHGSPDILYSRKQEISRSEVERQLKAIEYFSKRIKNAKLIDISQPLEDEVAEIEDIIVETLEWRLKRRVKRATGG